jgi:hypothetical protein
VKATINPEKRFRLEEVTPEPELGKAPFDEPLTEDERGLTREQLRQKHLLETVEGHQESAYEITTREMETAHGRQTRPTPGSKSQSLKAEIGNWAHKDLPRYLKYFEEKGEKEWVARLKEILNWPAGVDVNKLKFTMSDGRIGIPDGIDASEGIVYELKPDSESAWAQRGVHQASEYVAVLNKEHYAGKTDWRPVVIEYKRALLEKLLREWGILGPLPRRWLVGIGPDGNPVMTPASPRR